MRIDGTLQNTTWEACLDDLGTKLRDTIDTHGPESVGINFGTGVGMDAVGYRIAQSLHAAIGTPAKFSPLTIDGTAKVLMAELMGGSSALTGRPDYDNADVRDVHRQQSRCLPRPYRRPAESPRRDPRPREARRGLGRRPPPYRDRAARVAPSRAAAGHRLRGARLSGARSAARRRDHELPAQDVDALAAAVEPFTLRHAADDRRRARGRADTAAERGPPGGSDRDRYRHRRHDVAERQCHAMAFVGAADPHRIR